jgi:cold shock CspA family protein/ribosome-associated translation inhibitor RaiA
MQSTLKITARDFALSTPLEAEIRGRVAKLERFSSDIIDCEVAIEAPVGHHHKGGPYKVRIDLQIKGLELAISNRSADNLQVALREAFEAARRKLEDHSRRMQRETKRHESQPIARVSKLFADAGYGFIATPEGREIYFHRNSVLEPGFDGLQIGTEVRFDEEMGAQGPQATTVKAVDTYTEVLHKL